VSTSQKTQSVSVLEISQLMWYREIKLLYIFRNLKALKCMVRAKCKFLTLQRGCNYVVILVTTMLE